MNYIFVKADKIIKKVMFSDITHVKAMGDYIQIFTLDTKRIITMMTLSYFEEKTKNGPFIRIHRSYIINLDNLLSIEKNTCITKAGQVPIGPDYKSELMKRIGL